jgi:uncharacterized membrane protein YvbJ
MANCPYCSAAVPDGVQKCKHCGEWLTPKQPTDPKAGKDGLRMIGEAAKTGVTVYAVLAVVGLVVGLVFFLAFFLPSWNRAEKMQDKIMHQIDKGWDESKKKMEEGNKKINDDREEFFQKARPMTPDEVQGLFNRK